MFKKFYWSDYSKSKLLKLRFRDLELHTAKAPKVIISRFESVLSELEDKGITFRPHFWSSDEWFCPDGIAGVAIPFYLYHPTLRELERSFIGRVEGESKQEFKKILRHEIGHAMDNAYGLRKLKTRQKLFGLTSTEYPDAYKRPQKSDDFVDYLGDGYASSHPDEDWAETFATWLDPQYQWERRYKGKALEKLQYVNQLMRRLEGREPKQTQRIYWCTRTINQTLGEYYQEKVKRFKVVQKRKLLKRISQELIGDEKDIPATAFLKQHKKQFTGSLTQSLPTDYAGPLFNDFYDYCKASNLSFDQAASLEFLQSPALKRSILNQYSSISM